MVKCWNMATQLEFANPAVFSKPGFSGLESSKPGFLFWVCQWPTCDVTGLTAVKPVMSPDRRPVYSLLPNCFSCARASSAACTTPTIRNLTPESDWKHKNTSSINCKLEAKADWKSIFPVSYSYCHQSSLITYMVKLQQSVTQSAQMASSEQWCWSGERGILTELSLCYSIV